MVLEEEPEVGAVLVHGSTIKPANRDGPTSLGDNLSLFAKI
jgi:hypothetical protein